jgi:hypothetical protein
MTPKEPEPGKVQAALYDLTEARDLANARQTTPFGLGLALSLCAGRPVRGEASVDLRSLRDSRSRVPSLRMGQAAYADDTRRRLARA